MRSIYIEALMHRKSICALCKMNQDGYCLKTNVAVRQVVFMDFCPLNYWGGESNRLFKKPYVRRKKKTKLPSLLTRAKTLSQSLIAWGKAGFKKTPPKLLAKRLSICESCEHWDPTKFNNTGRCNKCGCSTWAKLRFKTAKCPIGKW